MVAPPKNRRVLSGAYWVNWVRTYAPTSAEIKDLDMNFRDKVIAFKKAMEAAHPSVRIDVSHLPV